MQAAPVEHRGLSNGSNQETTACGKRIRSLGTPGSILDRILSGVQLAMLATPGYLVAITLMAIFAVKLGWFATTGYVHLTDDPFGNLKSLLLPSIALGLEQVALYARVLRTDLSGEVTVRSRDGQPWTVQPARSGSSATNAGGSSGSVVMSLIGGTARALYCQ